MADAQHLEAVAVIAVGQAVARRRHLGDQAADLCRPDIERRHQTALRHAAALAAGRRLALKLHHRH
jgi:hypothetical protein